MESLVLAVLAVSGSAAYFLFVAPASQPVSFSQEW